MLKADDIPSMPVPAQTNRGWKSDNFGIGGRRDIFNRLPIPSSIDSVPCHNTGFQVIAYNMGHKF